MPLTAPIPAFARTDDAIETPIQLDVAKPKITFTFKTDSGRLSNEYPLEPESAMALAVLCCDLDFELALEIAAGDRTEADLICHALKLIETALQDIGIAP